MDLGLDLSFLNTRMGSLGVKHRKITEVAAFFYSDWLLTLDVELDVGDGGIPEAVVGGAHVVAGVMPRHRGERQAETTEEVLARWHLCK